VNRFTRGARQFTRHRLEQGLEFGGAIHHRAELEKL
jgi:hypothetical protein